jgi:tetratricopeptide (TPR) repeat protein
MKKFGFFIFTFFLAALLSGCAAKDMTLSNQGYEELTKANYDQAEKYFSEALYINPNNPYALLNLGQVYQETGHPARARQMYEKVIALAPSDKERQATYDSEEGKPLVEIAMDNLELLAGKSKPVRPKAMGPIEMPTSETMSPWSSPEEMASEPMEKPPEDVKIVTATEKGYYSVGENDSLYDIAGRKYVYSNPLKWPTLYRLNMNILGDMEVTKNFEYQELVEGLDLRIVTPDEASERLMALGEKVWAVHVRSTLESENIVPTAVRLMDKGYHVYMTRATVKGKEWTRLRVGFFRDEPEAAKIREKIVSFMNSTRDSWVTKIPKSELEKFGGY